MKSSSPFSDSHIYRDWFYLLLTFILGTTYFSLLITAYAVVLPLCLVIIGLPLLKLLNASMPYVAAFDQSLSAVLLGTIDVNDFSDDLIARSNRLRVGESVGYLFGRFPVGILTFIAACFLLPFLIIEALVNEMGVKTGMISAQVQHLLAVGLSGTGGSQATVDIPEKAKHDFQPEKPKNDFRSDRLDMDDSADAVYVLDDDGEIRKVKRGNGDDYLRERAERGNQAEFGAAMSKAPYVEPDEEDRL